MELLVRKKQVYELEVLYQDTKDNLYYCCLARKNEKILTHIDDEVYKILRFLHSYVKKYLHNALSKNLIKRCEQLKIQAKKDYSKSSNIHWD